MAKGKQRFPIPTATVKANAARGAKRSGKRSRIDPSTCQRDYTDDEREFMVAMDAYRRAAKRPFPTWSEALEVLKGLGYRKVAEGA